MKVEPHKVVSPKQLPSYLPITTTLTWWLALDHWNAPQWLWGVAGVLGVFLWAGRIITVWTQRDVLLRELQ